MCHGACLVFALLGSLTSAAAEHAHALQAPELLANRSLHVQGGAKLALLLSESTNATNATLPAADDVHDPDDEEQDPGADPSTQEGGATDTGPPIPVGVSADKVDGGQGQLGGRRHEQGNMKVPPVS